MHYFRISRASIILPKFVGSDSEQIKLPGLYVEQDDLPSSYIGVLVPGIGLVFRLVQEAVVAGVVVDIGDEIELEIPSQLLSNITQSAKKISMYFADFEAEYAIALPNPAMLTLNFVPMFPSSQDVDEEFLRGMTP